MVLIVPLLDHINMLGVNMDDKRAFLPILARLRIIVANTAPSPAGRYSNSQLRILDQSQ